MNEDDYNSIFAGSRQRRTPSDNHHGLTTHPTFQIPQFMYNGPPTLAPGGGAEVLPPGGSLWMENSGFDLAAFEGAFTTRYATPEGSPTPGGMRGYSSSLRKALESKFYDSSRSMSDSSAPYQSSAPFDYDSMPTVAVTQPSPPPMLSSSAIAAFIAPSPLGLPVYSTSGFDLLSIFGRLANRANPQIKLGPVDLTSAFTVVDVRRYDQPIVYCSPTFCHLTGYDEREVLAKNCRFLQAPPGVVVHKGEERKWTSNDAVKHIKKSLVSNKEVQASLVNYRKDGTAFINLITIIPVPEENGEPIYQLGFQVDLTQQPTAILDRLRDGSYISTSVAPPSDLHAIPKKQPPIPQVVVSDMLALPPAAADDSHPLSMVLLSATPDFFLVVSLKGLFLYVAPAVEHVLGYTPNELINKTLGDIAHAADVIPLMRELKDSSAPGEKPRPVDLLFRVKTSQRRWVWLECRGRLHVEPGKGRKAIVLSARVKDMGSLEASLMEGACGTVSEDGMVLVATREVAGWNPEELTKRSFYSLFEDMTALPETPTPLRTSMHRKDGSKMEVHVQVWKQVGGERLPRIYHISAIDVAVSGHSFNVFEELETDRESSWQYELQQLRFKNQRLQEQIRVIEDSVTPSYATYMYGGESESESYPVSMPWYGPAAPTLKRAWDGGT